jgi:hypothetical protein
VAGSEAGLGEAGAAGEAGAVGVGEAAWGDSVGELLGSGVESGGVGARSPGAADSLETWISTRDSKTATKLNPKMAITTG